jgi:hypothetical protein
VHANTLEELLALVQRDLAADSVRVVDAVDEPDAPPEDPTSLRCDLPGGRRLVVGFAEPPPDAEARHRRLAMLVAAFVDLLGPEGRPRTSRPPPARSLQEELAALAQRAGAVEALVIDARSPVVWGSGTEVPGQPTGLEEVPPTLRPSGVLHEVGPEDVAATDYGLASAQGLRVDPGAMNLVPAAVCARHRIMPVGRVGDTLIVAMADPSDVNAVYDVVRLTGLDVQPVFAGESMAGLFRHLDDGAEGPSYDDLLAAIPADEREAREARALRARDAWARTILSRRAIADVRALPETEALHRGGHVRHTVSGESFGYTARSFGGIYVVILVFGGPLDELVAKRAVTHALPAIERLVAALPPHEPPPPTAGVAAMRGSRRRR